MSIVFLDTGYLPALELSNDQNHQRATRHWTAKLKLLPQFVTTSYVFDEVVTLSGNRADRPYAANAFAGADQWGRRLYWFLWVPIANL